MLHPYRQAAARELDCPASPALLTPGQELLTLLDGINGWLEEYPCVQASRKDSTIYLFYRDAAFSVDDFWDTFAEGMARVNRAWNLCALGTAPSQESVLLSARLDEKTLSLTQSNLSGIPADSLQGLCLMLDCGDPQVCSVLLELLGRINWQTGAAALSWKDTDFLSEQKLILNPGSIGYFCYAGIGCAGIGSEYLPSLSFSQKMTLWSSFLGEGLNPAEFGWLAQDIAQNTLSNRMEWELALLEVLERLQIRVVNEDKSFAMFDGSGRRLYFGADDRRAAEWVLLKILFPLNYQ